MADLKYNYVIFTENSDFNRFISKDILDRKDVLCCYGPLKGKNRAVNLLYQFCFSRRANKIIKVPFKKIWNHVYFKNEFNDNKPICFLVDRFAQRQQDQSNYFSYLRKNYPGCKILLMFRDRVEGTSTPCSEAERRRLAERYDAILAYSLLDAEKFGYIYFPAWESRIPIEENKRDTGTDLFYAGWSKDRVPLLQQICRKANAEGLKSYFFVYHAAEEEKIPMEGMVYSDKRMPFKELLERAANAKCLVDILQGNAAGFTSRFWHAVFYNKLLITNNPIARFTRFYNPKWMQQITSADEIDFGMLRDDTAAPDYQYHDEFSPREFLHFVDEMLTNGATAEEYYKSWFDIKGYREYLQQNDK